MGETEYGQLIESDPRAVARLLVEKDREIEKLRNHLINAKHAQFGAKSERLSSINQVELFPAEELNTAIVENERIEVEVPAHKRNVKRARREIPEGTPVRKVEHPPIETSCECCGSELTQIRTEITKLLNYVPAHFEVEEHVRPVMTCSKCRDKAPITTPLPVGIQLIPRSPAGVGLLSQILISKYQDHLPLHRLEGMFARHGFELQRKRMCEWLGFIAELLHPLYKALKRELMQQRYLQADETTIKVQDGEEPGKCHTGYFWGLLGPPPLNLVYFHYADSRAAEVPKAILSGFNGILQTDLYAGYNEVYIPDSTKRAGCWAHVRRKFIEIRKLAEKDVQTTLELIAKLYQLERKGRTDSEILSTRQKHSTPLIGRLHQHLTTWSERTLPRSEVQKALQYALGQWDALTLFLSHPELQLDNNLIENQMRPIALGRKNWMFAGSHEGAMRAAIFFSLINSCRLNKINTWNYFNSVLPVLATRSVDDLTTLLPHKWTQHVKRGD